MLETPATRVRTELAISIVVATRNRCCSLEQMLQSLMTPKNLRMTDWEIIVADNGSSDRTASVCQLFRERNPDHFRFVFMPTPGKSRALNKALAVMRGKILALLDDDVICDPGYLAGVREIFASGFSHVAQGRTLVDYHCPRPAWFSPYFDQMMVSVDLGDELCELRRGFWGVNVAMPFEALAKAGGFCPEMGPGAIGLADDAELDHRLKRHGYRLFYSPKMVVRHQISGKRLTRGYVLKRSYVIGLSTAFYKELPAVPLWRYSLYRLKSLIYSVLVAAKLQCEKEPSAAMEHLCDALDDLGFFVTHLRFKCMGRPKLAAPHIISGCVR